MGKVVRAVGKVVSAVAGVVATVAAVVPGGQGIAAVAALVAAGAGIAAAIGGNKKAQVSPETANRLVASIDPDKPRDFVFGNTAMATEIRDQEYTNNDTYLHRFIVVASHEIESIDEIWFDSEKAWTASGGVQGDYSGYLTVATRTVGTAANAINVSFRMGGARRYTGLAYVHLRYRLTGDGDKASSPFSQAVPTRVTIRGKGAAVYDPRLDGTVSGGRGNHRAHDQSTWAWDDDASRNPALQLLWYLLGWKVNGKPMLGMGVPPGRIDLESFLAAANLCDETVSLAAGGTEPRYRSDGVFSEGDDPGVVISALEAAMNGRLRDYGGKLSLKIFVNDLASPVTDFDDSDIIDDFKWQEGPALEDEFNIVRGRYVDASDGALYQLLDYPAVRRTSPDGIDRYSTFELPTVQSASQAQRLAKQHLQRNLYRKLFTADFQLTAWRCQKDDVVRLTFSPLGFVNKLFRVLEQVIRNDGTVLMVLREEHADLYSWDEEESPPVVPADPSIFDPANAPLLQAVREGALTADWDRIRNAPHDIFDLDPSTGELLQSLPPRLLTGGREYWTNSGTLSAAALRAGTFRTDPENGIVLETDTANRLWAWRQAEPIAPDQILRFRVTFAVTAQPATGNTGMRLGYYSFSGGGARVNSNIVALSEDFDVGDGVVTREILIGGGNVDPALVDSVVGPRARYVRPHFRANYSGRDASTWQILQFEREDVSDLPAIVRAQASADGKITAFYQSRTPTAEGVGDIWFNTAGRKWYRWSGNAWALTEDAGIGVALAAAGGAQATADGKIATFYQAGAPTAEGVGDLWVDTDADPIVVKRWSGTSWQKATPDGALSVLDLVSADHLGVGPGVNQAINSRVLMNNDGWTTRAVAIGPETVFNTIPPGRSLALATEGTLRIVQDGNNGGAGGGTAQYEQDFSVEGGSRIEASAYTGIRHCVIEIFLEFFDGDGNSLGNGTVVAHDRTNDATPGSGRHGLSRFKRVWVITDAPRNAARGRMIMRKRGTPASEANSLGFFVRPYFGSCWPNQTEPSPWAPGIEGATPDQIDAIADAQGDADTAQATADGKITAFYQSRTPTAEGIGDIWFNTAGRKWYRWSGNAWALTEDAGIGVALAAAGGAQATADGKIATFYQAGAPTAEGVGDLWVDTDADPIVVKRWSGTSWQKATPDGALSVLDLVSADHLGVGPGVNQAINSRVLMNNDGWTTRAVAIGPETVFNTIPPGRSLALATEGTLRIVQDGNNGGAGGGTAQYEQDFSVEGGSRIEASAYTGIRHCVIEIFLEFFDGDGNSLGNGTVVAHDRTNDATPGSGRHGLSRFKRVWVITDAPRNAARGRMIMRKRGTPASEANSLGFFVRPYFGSCWPNQTEPSPWAPGIEGATPDQIDAIADAQGDADTAQATADGKITAFYQSRTPTAEGIGDIWFNTAGRKWYRWSGSAWALTEDAGIGAALADAAGAQATADGKIVTFYQARPPVAEGVGDLWVDTDASPNKVSRWTAPGEWVLVQHGDVTADNQVALEGARTITVTRGYAGGMLAPKSAQFPIERRFRLTRGDTDIGALGDWSVSSPPGITLAIDAAGVLSITAMTAAVSAAQLVVEADYGGRTYRIPVQLVFKDDPLPVRAAGPSAFSDLVFPESTAWTTISEIMSVEAADTDAVIDARIIHQSTIPIQLRIRFGTAGDMSGASIITTGRIGQPRGSAPGFGTISGSAHVGGVKTGLTAGITYYFDVQGRRTSGGVVAPIIEGRATVTTT